MKIRFSIIIALLLLSGMAGVVQEADASELGEIFLFKATVETDEGTLHWEYNSPSGYEFHKGDHAYHGERAKEEVTQLYASLQPEEKMSKEDLAARFKEEGFSNLKRLDVRWENENGELHTWLWEKSSNT